MDEELKRQLERVGEALTLPSFNVGISYQGKRSFHSFGFRDGIKDAVDSKTIYPLASASKAFIAASVLMLASEGLCELDKPVHDYLPEIEFYVPYMTEQITIRDILSHRTGLPRHDVQMILQGDVSLSEMMYLLRFLPPAYKLRERFHYQNHMFGLATYLVEELSGKPWQAFVQERILSPLKMKRTTTGFHDYYQIDDNYVAPLVLKEGKNVPIPEMNPDNLGCCGSISASIEDLLTWGEVNLGQGTLRGVSIYPQDCAVELHKPTTPIRAGDLTPMPNPDEVSSFDYGLGWFIETYRDHKLVQHGGTLFGYKSLVGFMPDLDLAFAILINQNSTLGCEVMERYILDAYLKVEPNDWVDFYQSAQQVLKDKKAKTQKKLFGDPKTKVDYSRYVGVYQHPAYGQISFEVGENCLVGTAGTAKFQLVPGKADQFVLTTAMDPTGSPCHFIEGEKGAAVFSAKLDEDCPQNIEFVRVE